MAALPVSAADQVNQERLLNVDKEPGNWLHHHQNYSAHRFSSLKEINRDNVKNLKVAWTMHLGGIEGGGIWSHGGLEGTPHRRERLPLRHRWLGLGLQDRCAWRPRRAGLEDGSEDRP